VLDHPPVKRSTERERELRACVELRERVWAILREAKDEWDVTAAELNGVLLGTFARATKTYRAVLLLANFGYGEQAGMLNRSLFEHAVVLLWLTLAPDEEVLMDRLRAHHAHARVLYSRSAEEHPELELDLKGRSGGTSYISSNRSCLSAARNRALSLRSPTPRGGSPPSRNRSGKSAWRAHRSGPGAARRSAPRGASISLAVEERVMFVQSTNSVRQVHSALMFRMRVGGAAADESPLFRSKRHWAVFEEASERRRRQPKRR
jgi:hypothetical protein